MKSVTRLLAACILLPAPFVSAASLPYPIVGTGQTACYGDRGPIDPPDPGEPFCGQDAQRGTTPPHYRDNGDGTVTDTVTGLMWQRDPGSKMTFDEAEAAAKACRLGGHDDWRIPTVKELYSLILFTGESQGEHAVRPYIDTRYFIQPKADTDSGEREIDVQTWSCTRTSDPVMGGQEAAFGVNFADGRIKGYPLSRPDGPNRLYFRFVRGNPDYGRNLLFDNGDGTVSDYATGLMWQKADAGRRMDWESALAYAEALTLAGHTDWHLPTAKELQSIVDYTRTPALHPLFEGTPDELDDGLRDLPYYWTSTTHLDGRPLGSRAVYLCFGQAWGRNPRTGERTDVHGAGAQRSDPKKPEGAGSARYFGPQKDLLCSLNGVRCVRRMKPEEIPDAWQFAVVGDTHVPAAALTEALTADLETRAADAILFPGDLVQGGRGCTAETLKTELSAWKRRFAPLAARGVRLLAVRGNHEADVRGSDAVWKSFFGTDGLNLRTRFRNVCFIGLDTYALGERTVDEAWLRDTLRKCPAGTHIVPFGHEPAFSCHTYHPHGLDADTEARDRFWTLLEEARVPYWFCGHAHRFSAARITSPDGKRAVTQIVSGGGGGPLHPAARSGRPAVSGITAGRTATLLQEATGHGYLLVTVTPTALQPVWIPVAAPDTAAVKAPRERTGPRRPARRRASAHRPRR